MPREPMNPPMRERMTIAEARRRGLIPRGPQGPSRSKYRNQRTFYNGRWYSSKKEAERAGELDLLVRSGSVKRWEAQPKFPIVYEGIKICSYIGDFKVEYPNGKIVIEDTKGFQTAIYKLKKKLVKAFYGIEIKEL